MKFSEAGKGTYVAVKFTEATLDAIEQIQNQLNLFEPTPRGKLHTTICFSRVNVPYMPSTKGCVIGTSDDFAVFEHNGKRALVLLLDSKYLHDRHEYAMALGATYDFPDYQPHITLAYDIGAREKPSINGFAPIPIEITHEYVEDLDLDWSPKK